MFVTYVYSHIHIHMHIRLTIASSVHSSLLALPDIRMLCCLSLPQDLCIVVTLPCSSPFVTCKQRDLVRSLNQCTGDQADSLRGAKEQHLAPRSSRTPTSYSINGVKTLWLSTLTLSSPCWTTYHQECGPPKTSLHRAEFLAMRIHHSSHVAGNNIPLNGRAMTLLATHCFKSSSAVQSISPASRLAPHPKSVWIFEEKKK